MLFRTDNLSQKPHIVYIRRLILAKIEDKLVATFEEQWRILVLWLRKKGVRTVEDAEDIASSVWVEVLDAIRLKRVKKWSSAIVYHVARQRFVDYVRSRKRSDRLIESLETGDVIEADYDRDILISNLVGKLPGDERAVIEKVYLV